MASKKKTPGINGASMADISFILLIFFLMVTTMGSEYGMLRQLPPWVGDNVTEGAKINERNVFVVSVNENSDLLVKNNFTQVSELRSMTKDFYNLSNTGDGYPAKIQKELPLIGTITVNENAVVSLQNARGTSYRTYLQVQNELTAAIHELRDEFCMQNFGRLYDDCTQDQQDVVGKDVFPMSISEAEPRDVSIKK